MGLIASFYDNSKVVLNIMPAISAAPKALGTDNNLLPEYCTQGIPNKSVEVDCLALRLVNSWFYL